MKECKGSAPFEARHSVESLCKHTETPHPAAKASLRAKVRFATGLFVPGILHKNGRSREELIAEIEAS